MAKYKVIKVPLNDNEEDKPLKLGDVIERKVKEVEVFEKKFGKDYLERVEEESNKKSGE